MSKYPHLYKTARWNALRKRQLSHHPLCSRCADEGRVQAATVVHHVVRHNGDPELFFKGQLRSVCKRCHDSIEQTIERSGYALATGIDGWARVLK